jgi:hypothetical protein
MSLPGEKDIKYTFPVLWGWITHIQSLLSTKRWIPKVDYTLETFSYKQAHVDTEQLMHIDWLLNKSAAPIIIVIPGIAGHSNDGYVRCFAQYAHEQGYTIAVVNRPGCGYHYNTNEYYPIKCHRLHLVGHHKDIEIAVEHIKNRFPNNKLFAAGFSLGGNNLLKYLGHAKSNCPISAAVTICAPYNLAECEKMLKNEQKMYASALTATLKRVVSAHAHVYTKTQDISVDTILKAESLSEFDSLFTVKLLDNVQDIYRDYYTRNSCHKHWNDITVPVFCINAGDDVISPQRLIPYDVCATNENIIFATSKFGGHLGFFEGSILFPSRFGAFSDRLTTSFFKAYETCDAAINSGI